MDKKLFAKVLIDEFGGQQATARILDMHSQSLYHWLEHGVPKHRLAFMRLAFPKILKRAEDKFAAMQG